MTELLILTGAAALAALVFVVLAWNHRAELGRRRLVRDLNRRLRPVNNRWGHRD